MTFKRLTFFAVAVVSLGIVLLALFSPIFSSLRSSLSTNKEINLLSGREGPNGPILVVKIDDTTMAHPQVGLEKADLIYIEQVEGGLTRLAALFSSHIPQRVGPVRSARISDIELLEQYGKVGFAYSGAQRKLLPVIAGANLVNLGAQSQPSSIYTTDPDRTPPYAMILRADLLMNKVQEQKIVLSRPQEPGWRFASETSLGELISSARVTWPASAYEVRWSMNKGKWELLHSGKPNLNEAGDLLTADTFVIQLVSITDSEYRDKVGGVTPFSATVGSGRGYILRDGKSIAARWSRKDGASGTQWQSATGEMIPFKAGAIWIALTDKEPTFTLNNEDATRSGTK